jgi:hypothetical protein
MSRENFRLFMAHNSFKLQLLVTAVQKECQVNYNHIALPSASYEVKKQNQELFEQDREAE